MLALSRLTILHTLIARQPDLQLCKNWEACDGVADLEQPGVETELGVRSPKMGSIRASTVLT